MKCKILYVFAIVLLLLASCSTKRKAIATKPTRPVISNKTITQKPSVPKEAPASIPEISNPEVVNYKDKVHKYVITYAQIAKREMQQYGIPASITLAQGVLESGAGNGSLARKANNHFGIKCHGWKGAKVYHDDDRAQECFRKYKEPEYSFEDHSLFLSGRSRYANLFKLKKDDYKGWARGLRAAGYATDKKYPVKLISIIERYRLYEYDSEVLGKSREAIVKVEKIIEKKAEEKSEQYVVSQGDTLYSIARQFQLSVEELKGYNGLSNNTIHLGQKLYVVPITTEFD